MQLENVMAMQNYPLPEKNVTVQNAYRFAPLDSPYFHFHK
jgi:hypothetical protein